MLTGLDRRVMYFSTMGNWVIGSNLPGAVPTTTTGGGPSSAGGVVATATLGGVRGVPHKSKRPVASTPDKLRHEGGQWFVDMNIDREVSAALAAVAPAAVAAPRTKVHHMYSSNYQSPAPQWLPMRQLQVL